MKFRIILLSALLLCSFSAGANPADRRDVKEFIDTMARDHGFDTGELRKLFARVKRRQDILDAISRPAESKPWYKYRPIFITESRISQGVEFWDKNAGLLAKAEQEYGVSAAIIVAIIGVETRYGRNTGGYRVMDALTTLGFDYPPRGAFFKGQLKEFLIMAREEGIDPLELKGSYAGAMGLPQFIPSSFRSFAVDFDQDGRRDLWENTADVIGSVANYFHQHKWRPGEAVAVRADVKGNKARQLADKGAKPSIAAGQLGRYGVTPGTPLSADTEVSLLALESSEGASEYWIGLNNFYVITRYNRSPLYAMAVYQLSEAIRTTRASTQMAGTRQ